MLLCLSVIKTLGKQLLWILFHVVKTYVSDIRHYYALLQTLP